MFFCLAGEETGGGDLVFARMLAWPLLCGEGGEGLRQEPDLKDWEKERGRGAEKISYGGCGRCFREMREGIHKKKKKAARNGKAGGNDRRGGKKINRKT